MFYSRKVSRSGLVLFRSGAAGARKDRSVASRTSDKRGLAWSYWIEQSLL
jgi:hypothetical protein